MMKNRVPLELLRFRSTTWRRLVLLLAFSGMGLVTGALVVMPGCSTPKAGRLSASAGDQAELDAGFTLLYELLGDEAQVERLLILKSASHGTEQLLKDIATSSSNMQGQLREMVDADATLSLDVTGLPKVETSARLAISSETAMTLLGTVDDDFEFNVLLSQEKAMSYGAHLAAALSQSDPNPTRSTVLEEMSKTMAALHDEIMRALLARCSGS